MGSTYTSPQGSMNGSILSVNSGSSSDSKSRSIASSITRSVSDREPLHEDEEVESHLQVELKSLIQSHEHLGKQASSLGEELAQTRAEALALKTQLEDATSKLTPSPTKAPLSPVEAPSFSSEVVCSPSIHEEEEVLALKTQIDLLATDITKDETLKLLEAAEAKHCMEPIQSDKEDALVVAATTASDAKLLAIRCAALEVTVQRLMEGLENKNRNYSAKKSPSGGIHASCSQLSEASDCEAKLQVSADSATTEGVDAMSIEVTGPFSAGLDASTNDVSETQEATIKFLGTIGAVRPCNNIAAAGESGDGTEQQRSRLSVVGNGRLYGNNTNNRSITAPGAYKTNKLVMMNPSRSSSAAAAGGGTSEKKTATSTKKNTNTFFQEIGFVMKNNVVSLVVKGTAGLVLLGVVSRLVRGGGGGRRWSTAKGKSRSFQSPPGGQHGGSSFRA